MKNLSYSVGLIVLGMAFGTVARSSVNEQEKSLEDKLKGWDFNWLDESDADGKGHKSPYVLLVKEKDGVTIRKIVVGVAVGKRKGHPVWHPLICNEFTTDEQLAMYTKNPRKCFVDPGDGSVVIVSLDEVPKELERMRKAK